MTIRYAIITVLVMLMVSLAAPVVAFAAQTVTSGGVDTSTVTNGGGSSNTGATLLNPLQSGTSLSSFLSSILAFVIRIGTIVIILMLVYIGYKFVIAQGKPGEIEAAKKMLLWTIIGALVLLGAQAISSAIQATVSAIGG